ncbi:MAG: hypothetical protein ACK5DK_04480, partial [Brevundimonas sp.]|uniref:hypothetical protein n=1 Tax=Brevundimonas sp. TaxID=1871086 RepID=UPI00391CA3CC
MGITSADSARTMCEHSLWREVRLRVRGAKALPDAGSGPNLSSSRYERLDVMVSAAVLGVLIGLAGLAVLA